MEAGASSVDGMLEASGVRLPLDAGLPGGRGLSAGRGALAAALGVRPDDVASARLLRRSVDARRKSDVRFVASFAVRLAEGAVARPAAGVRVQPYAPKPRHLPLDRARAFAESGRPRPVVVGSGPAGLFCAWYLAKAGLRPVLVERGPDVGARMRAVAAFDGGGPLDPNANIQFGEGGAGTFSDGKLTTNIKSPFAADVLDVFAQAGAPDDILWQAKPHIGTDELVGVVRRLREQIREAGGTVLFRTQATGFDVRDGAVRGVRLRPTAPEGKRALADGAADGIRLGAPNAEGERLLFADAVVLACGHSARDTFEAVLGAGFAMEQKPFSVGVRIEHPQTLVDRAQYGPVAGHPALGPADYKLSVQVPDGCGGRRGVYTFCMCPGGEVVCAASEPETVVVNGMSRHARDGRNANSALLVGVGPGDFGSDHPLAGVEFQRAIERAAFRCAVEAGGAPGSAPAQTAGTFLAGEPASADDARLGEPTYARGVAWCSLDGCLPPFVADALRAALPLLDRKLRGFADAGAVLTGVETRSSSPVRILRGADLQAFAGSAADGREAGASGLYPCGEGAGYAGGIMSAACDGLRVASAIAATYES